ncbi:hypothetical protein J437_LFUL009811 [Ladona fulva]|uniref:Uncharacterized protein n=1 Tax=Ladona fulva TaxID=123851 RepID=A0A8K0P248_LADFU|nr:hypothetical protein J437_LFUL009811 [Ladona fulva]
MCNAKHLNKQNAAGSDYTRNMRSKNRREREKISKELVLNVSGLKYGSMVNMTHEYFLHTTLADSWMDPSGPHVTRRPNFAEAWHSVRFDSDVLCNTGGLIEVPLRSLPASVEHLSLAKNDIPVIRSDAFAGLRSLQKLQLDGNNISVIRPFAFRGLPRLRELSITNAPLQALSQFAFAGLQNVTRILLPHNKIARIEGYAFAGTSNVRLLLLSHNPLLRIERAAFAGLSHVERLVLPAGIRSIDPDAFNGLRSVGLLRMAFMDLSPPGLRSHTFRGLARVAVLAIHESDLGVLRAGAFEGLAAVGSLDLVGNKVPCVK